MKKNNLFKTEAFKCVIVLFLITVLMCGLLAILNDVLSVPQEERLNRAVMKVYGKSVEATAKEIDPARVAEDLGSVDEYYAFTDEGVSYELFKSTGSNGYKNGTVTMWILIEAEDGEAVSVKKAVLDSYEKQTLMSSFGEEFFDRYTSLTKDQLEDGVLFKTGKPNIDNNAFFDGNDVQHAVSGATRSSNAANNAVNVVLLYVWGDLS